MAVLVLGGAGYIGSHTVYELIAGGYETVVVDNLETGHIEAVHGDAKFYRGNIRDKEFMRDVLSKESIDGVIHFAAYSLVGESVENPLKYYENNLCGTRDLLEVLVEKNVDKVVFSSTAAVYGEPERIPILESDRTQPTNPYGETKLAMERMFRWAGEAHGLRYVSLRYFNACGAHGSGSIGEDHDPETHLIPVIMQAATGKRDRLFLYGDDYQTPDGTCIRDYIHVTDLAQAHILALEYLNRGGESNIFNLGNGEGFSVLDVIKESRNVTGSDLPVEVVDRRPGDPAYLVASSAKARELLKWKPVYGSLNGMISSAYRWHKEHPNGYGG